MTVHSHHRRPALRALVYGDVNLNLIDGSAVWLASTAECLARSGVEVTVLLKARIETDRLLQPLLALPGVKLLEPGGTPRTPGRAAAEVQRLHDEQPFDLIVVRGSRAASAMVDLGTLRSVLWTYLTDIPQSVTDLDRDRNAELTRIVRGSRRVLCQTPELRTFVEAVVSDAAGRTVLWEPIIPDIDVRRTGRSTVGDPLRIGYAGKFAPAWNTDLMLDLPAQLADRGIPVDLHMVGDKIHRDDADFAQRMVQGLATSSVQWHGGLDRTSTLELMATWDIGLSWRDRLLDSSLELSTKVLEYASVGTPPLLNRTPMHVRLLGEDYPLFTTPTRPAVDVLAAVHTDRTLLQQAAERARAAAEHYRMGAAVERTRHLLARAFPSASQSTEAARATRVVIAGHDLKFMRGIADLLSARHDFDVRIDEWSALAVHDEQVSRDLLAWADVIICEWAGPNAVWYSTRKQAHQRLIIRLHRFELDAPWIRDVDPSSIERVVCVNEHYRRRVVDEVSLAADTVVVVPNAVDREAFDRPKAPGAERVLGMLGIVPMRKRPDRALGILRALNAERPGFLLSLKSGMPWEHAWVWRRPQERAAYRALFDEIAQDPALRGAVVVEGHGGDVPAWLQRTGWVLSLSEDESFHLAPAEGMAAGSVPALLHWPGATDVYETQYVHADEAAIVEHILDVTIAGTWHARSAAARTDFPDAYDLPAVAQQWAQLLTEGG
jgi:glycosyltransferase involved in cell wall biosynthesis